MTIISLTTIPSRFSSIGPVLESLVAQRADIHGVLLWIPQTYRKREFSQFDLPRVPKGVEIRRCPYDFGPATKILPACEYFKPINPDTRILYCDDDRIYAPDWAAGFIAESDAYPDCAIANIGTYAKIVLNRETAPMRKGSLWRALTGKFARAQYKRNERALFNKLITECHGFVDIAKGFGGILVKPKFFSHAAFTIPDQFWAVDDIWLSGQMAVQNVGIKQLGVRADSALAAGAEIDALLDLSVASQNRVQLDASCVRYFQSTHGIWIS